MDPELYQYPAKSSSDQQPSEKNAFAPAFSYGGSLFDANKYSVKGLVYPDDLMADPMSNRYGGNKVVFYINTAVDSRLFKNNSQVAVVGGVQKDRMRGGLINQNISGLQAGAAAGIAGTAAGGIAAGALGGSNSVGAGGLAGGAIGVAGTALIAGNAPASDQEVPPSEEKPGVFTRPQKRLRAAIALYIPNQLNVRYSVGWGEEDTLAFSALARGAEEIGRAFSKDINAKRTGGLVGEVLAAAAINAAPFGKEQALAAGLAVNPKKEQAFKNVDFRTFTFDYQFSPRSSAEAQNVLNIVRAFKYHMHPEFKSEDQFLYVYPSEFDIAYYKGINENLAIHRHTSCVLTEMNVNYTPNGSFSTFADGTPTQINMSLTFRELQLLSKETIEKYL
jgi:hypothetical protein